MLPWPHWIGYVIIFLVGAWVATKWPAVNVIGRVTG